VRSEITQAAIISRGLLTPNLLEIPGLDRCRGVCSRVEIRARISEECFTRGGVADALRGAQLAIMSRSPDPLTWGAFVCQGDTGPLELFAPTTQEVADSAPEGFPVPKTPPA
jgi:hypothetical protein